MSRKKIAIVIIAALVLSVAIVMPNGNPSSEIDVQADMNLGTTLFVGGSGPGNYTNIQDAIDNASNWDTVFIYNGIHYEHVKVKKSRSGMIFTTVTYSNIDINVDNLFLSSLDYTPHEPIQIYKNEDFTEQNGVIGGTGTENDPYVIAGWDINASDETGILIWNTDVYFVIENCWIHDGIESRHDGIDFINVSNGAIRNTICSNANYGIDIRESDNCVVENVTLLRNDWGLLIGESSFCQVTNNSANFNIVHGLRFGSCSNLMIHDNEANRNEWGILLWNCSFCEINNNSANFNIIHGLRFDDCSNITINDNEVIGNEHGIDLLQSNNSVVSRNIVSQSVWGISILGMTWFCSNNTMTQNYIAACEYGILAWDAINSNMSANNVFENNRSFSLEFASNTTVVRNNIINNIEGISISDSQTTLFEYNNIVNNGIPKVFSVFSIHLSSGTTVSKNNFINNSMGIDLREAQMTLVEQNNFINNGIPNALSLNSYHTTWNRNYWSNWPWRIPKPILAFGSPLWLNFDWHPLTEPYREISFQQT